MRNRSLYYTLGVFGVIVFAVGVIVSSYLSSPNEAELEACPWGNCEPEKRRTEPGKGLTGEIRAKASVGSKRALDLGEETLSSIEAAAASVNDWQERYAALPSSSVGKAIAGDDSLVAAFYAEWKNQPPPPYNLASSRRDVERLLEPVRGAAESEDNRFAPSETLIAEIQAEKRRADALRGKYEERKRAIDSVLARASSATGSGQTLEKAHAALQGKKLEEEAENDKLADARKNVLAVRALSSATRVEFLAFLQPGRWQGAGRVSGGEPRPFSYQALASTGALSDFRRYLELATSSSNDRPREPFPSTTAQWDAARERFKKFQDYAPIWRENGWLSP